MEPVSHHVAVRRGGPGDGSLVRRILLDTWGITEVVAHGVRYDASTLPSYLAEIDGEPVGLVTTHDVGAERELVTVNALLRGAGVGAALLRAVESDARAEGIRRLWLITTNDNTRALRFYQRMGWDLVALRRDELVRSRVLKPSIPQLGEDGIPIRHELELELLLG